MSRFRLMLVLTAALAAVFGVLPQFQAHAQEPEPEPAVMSIRAPEGEVANDADPFPVAVEIKGAENLGAFLFLMTYDDEVVTVKEIRQGPFLGSSGREVSCDTAIVQAGQARFTCVTLRPTPAEGASGDGVLAEVIFEPNEGGTTELALSRVDIKDPSAGALPLADPVGATLRVEKDSGLAIYWLIAIGVAGGVVLLIVFEVVRRLVRSRRTTAEAM